jgi:anti-sigma regulatory factor (Ser/Thr protein kinase)
MKMVHETLLYRSDDELVQGLVPFLGDALADGHPAVVVTTTANSTLLRDALGADANSVSFIDSASWYTRPARAIARYRALIDDHLAAGARRLSVVGEVVFGRTERDHRTWVRYESMLNTVFASDPVHILCPYDERRLPHGLIAAAAQTHRIVRHRSSASRSLDYRTPEQLLDEVRELPTDPPPNRTPLVGLHIEHADLPAAREAIREAGARAGVEGLRLEQLVLAANEIVTNALVHGAPPVSVQVWSDGQRLVCQVADKGPGIDDPLAGFRPPARHEGPEGQMGLWIARQLCDELELLAGGSGLTVRMTLAL